MEARRGRLLEYAVLLCTLVAVPIAAMVVLEVTVTPSLDVSRIPRWTAVAGLLFLIGAITLPAFILSGWLTAQEEATRKGPQ